MPTPTTPKLCHHRAQNQGYVTLNGREFYLGHWPASRGKKPPLHVQAAYDDLIAKWLTNNRQLPEERPPLSVNEVLLAYMKWAEQHYVPKRKKDDQNRFIRYAAAVVRELFGRTPAAEFGPKKLKAVRQAMVERDWCRNMVNAQVDRVKRMFKWAVAEELVPGDVYHALRAVESLRRGAPGVRETEPVKPVPVEAVEAILPFLQPVMRAMVRVTAKNFRDLPRTLTATPMQLAAHEVHDLLLLAGVDDPHWGPWSRLRDFERFFDRLRTFPSAKADRAGVVEMTRRAVDMGAQDLSPAVVPPNWAAFQWQELVRKIRNNGPGLGLALQGLLPNLADRLAAYLARQTPLGVHMFRYTRETLRVLKREGRLTAGLAERRPEDVPVEFRSEAESALYNRIDELCKQFYKSADVEPAERAGVGFLMAVFRKRLASSFAAFRLSLERRRDLIEAVQHELAGMDEAARLGQTLAEGEDEDDDAAVPAAVAAERARLLRLWSDPERRPRLEAERLYLCDYITELGVIDTDSKFCEFADRLDDVLAAGRRVIVFTQYLDTLDFIRDQLIARYGDRMACYSGRGGEVWDTVQYKWRVVDKADVKARCKRTHARPIDILLGTDAASEGLNLQDFSALFNYDLPWNPMRVEQRIGRIDRIGQAAPEVVVANLYLTGTIEEDAYWTLKDRIGAFENVVGPLQPILAEMPRIFRKLAQGEIERDEARRQIEEARQKQAPAVAAAIEGLTGDADDTGDGATPGPSVSQAELAGWCLAHPAEGMQVRSVPEPGTTAVAHDGRVGCLAVTWPYAPPELGIASTEEVLVTFNGEVADRHPPTGPTSDAAGVEQPGKEGVRLLTWGDPYLTAWLEAVRGELLSDADYQDAGFHSNASPLS